MVSRRRAAKLDSSVFKRCLFAGWFSATAGKHDTSKPHGCKRHCGRRRRIAIAAFVRHTARSMSKRFYITTAIDYVNGQPHLGHAYEKIIADVITRAHRSFGEEVFFLTGLDEHGQKVQQAAQKEGKQPQAYLDELAADWKSFAARLQLTNDDFIC